MPFSDNEAIHDGGTRTTSSQPAPVVNDSVPVSDQVQQYLQRRKEFGMAKYGTPLQAHNGRDALIDAFEEATDLVQYLAQAIIERDGKLPDVGVS